MIQNSVPELFSLQAQKKLRSGSEFRCITDGQNKVLTHILSHKMWSTELIWHLKDSLERGNVESLQGTRRTASHNLDTQVTFSLKNSCKNKKHNASPSIFFPVHCISPLSPCELLTSQMCQCRQKSTEGGPVFLVVWFQLYLFMVGSVFNISWVLSIFIFKPIPGDEVYDYFPLRGEEIETLGSYEKVTEILTRKPQLHW